MAQQRSSLPLILLLIPGLLLGLVLTIPLLFTSEESADLCIPGSGQAAVSVDPATVPDKPIAGYGREQLVNAAHIMKAGQALGLSVRDQTIGVMTAMGESSLIVIDHGDSAGPDSRGLFQQRANGAWGSYADRMDPTISATNFFKALQKIGNRDTLSPTQVAHRVQRNQDANHYTKYWSAAVQVVEGLSGVTGTATAEKPAAGSSTYKLGAVKPQTAAVANALGPMFGLKTIGGYRESARDPKGHPSGLALDFMIDDVPDGMAVGDRLAQYLIDNHEALGVDYFIWKQRSWRAGRGYKPMEDRGSITQNHFDHVHLNVKPDVTNPVIPDGTGLAAAAACGVTSTTEVSSTGWASPGAGPLNSPYGWRSDPLTGKRRLHTGTDLQAGGDGGPIYAAQAGVVVDVYTDRNGGWTIDIDHGGGIMTRYKHMWDHGILVKTGDQVAAGQQIAKTGSSGWSTGPHLHFEVRVNGEATDPAAFMKSVGITLG